MSFTPIERDCPLAILPSNVVADNFDVSGYAHHVRCLVLVMRVNDFRAHRRTGENVVVRVEDVNLMRRERYVIADGDPTLYDVEPFPETR